MSREQMSKDEYILRLRESHCSEDEISKIVKRLEDSGAFVKPEEPWRKLWACPCCQDAFPRFNDIPVICPVCSLNCYSSKGKGVWRHKRKCKHTEDVK